MKKTNTFRFLLFISVSLALFAVSSCKKDKKSSSSTTTTTTTPTPTVIGLYGADSSVYRNLYVAVSKVGTSTGVGYLYFDTGSGGMVIDASELVPTSNFTTSGFTFTGDSTVINGITIINQKETISYGDDSTTTKVYGNLAYAPVTIGDATSGSVVIKRVPFFIYYRAVYSDGSKAGQGDFDIFGVNDEYDVIFGNNVNLQSPLVFFTQATGLTSGFKLAALGAESTSDYLIPIPGALTLGLTSADLASTSGFNMTQLTFYSGSGYPPIIPATITYGTKTASSNYSAFDTGTTAPYSYMEDSAAPNTIALLPNNTSLKIASTSGFSYPFTTSASNQIYLENPKVSGTTLSIFGLEYFVNNEFLEDYTNHKIGLKIN